MSRRAASAASRIAHRAAAMLIGSCSTVFASLFVLSAAGFSPTEGDRDSNDIRSRFPSARSRVDAAENGVYESTKPFVINTWAKPGFVTANGVAMSTLRRTDDRVGAVVAGCGACERLQCDGSVGYGNHPDERGEVTLDAMIMDGPGHLMGAVGDLRRVRNAVGVARAVMDHTDHSLLVGESATQFALEMGFSEQTLSSNSSKKDFEHWQRQHCQPNFRRNVSPDPRTSCGPYKPLNDLGAATTVASGGRVAPDGHDTIGVIAMDSHGDIAAATTTNGAAHKIPGSDFTYFSRVIFAPAYWGHSHTLQNAL